VTWAIASTSGAGDEDARLGGEQHETADVVAARELGDQPLELRDHFAGEDVGALARQIEGERRQAIGPDVQTEGFSHRSFSDRRHAR
jgi:hypothetical protein